MTPEEQEQFIAEQDARKAAEAMAEELRRQLSEQQKLCDELKEQNHKFFLRLTSDSPDIPADETDEDTFTTEDIIKNLKGE